MDAPSDSLEMDSQPESGAERGRKELSQAQLALIEGWVQLADSLGLPKSFAQIYGLIFCSKRPVSAQDCVDALKISRSSAGQGIKALRDVGAIRPAFELGARREAFVIEPDLGVVVQSLAKARLLPAFHAFSTRLEEIERTQVPQNAFLVGRIQKLHRWQTKLNRINKWLLK